MEKVSGLGVSPGGEVTGQIDSCIMCCHDAKIMTKLPRDQRIENNKEEARFMLINV